MAKAKVTIEMDPTELELVKRALFVYELVVKFPSDIPTQDIRDRVKTRYGIGLKNDLPMSLAVAAKKVRISLH